MITKRRRLIKRGTAFRHAWKTAKAIGRVRVASAALFLLLCTGTAAADEVLAAVAANFATVAQKLAPVFQRQTGHVLKFSIGSSGKFAAQIENGAPFQVFLSADRLRPQRLEEKGLGVKGSRFVYASGKLALWSPMPGYVGDKGQVLSRNTFRKIAIANPKAAPYGEAAVDVLRSLSLAKVLKPKLVQGENIAQTFQFVETGNAQLGFIAMSQLLALDVGKRGSWWEVPTHLYHPIAQEAVLLKNGERSAAAKAFLEFLRSDQAKVLIRESGYDVP